MVLNVVDVCLKSRFGCLRQPVSSDFIQGTLALAVAQAQAQVAAPVRGEVAQVQVELVLAQVVVMEELPPWRSWHVNCETEDVYI